MEIEPLILEGQHVRLEPLSLAHEQALILAAGDGDLWKTTVTIIPDRSGMRTYIQAALDGQAHERELPFLIVNKATQQAAGTTRFYEISRTDRKAAIGYTWLAQSAQRTPINTEAKLLLLRHGFENWKCVRIELITDVLNEQSRDAILRLGAKQEGILRKHLVLPSGRIRDSVVFSIVDDEWPEVKARLLAKLARTCPAATSGKLNEEGGMDG